MRIPVPLRKRLICVGQFVSAGPGRSRRCCCRYAYVIFGGKVEKLKKRKFTRHRADYTRWFIRVRSKHRCGGVAFSAAIRERNVQIIARPRVTFDVISLRSRAVLFKKINESRLREEKIGIVFICETIMGLYARRGSLFAKFNYNFSVKVRN